MQKAFAKVNIFLKITGVRDGYHTLASRFMVVKDLYDEVDFFQKDKKEFVIDGKFDCDVEQNTIYKAYKELLAYAKDKTIEEFFETYGIRVIKNIPSFAGLGGGSSDSATFLKMTNERLKLGLSVEELSKIGARVGADVPFFIYGYKSANVRGIGEIVEKFEEDVLDIKTITPKIAISTPLVYKKYRSDFFSPISKDEEKKFLELTSKEALEKFDIYQANDLYKPALSLYPKLKTYQKDGWFFSGSGSSFFKINDIIS
jgi:4-diphosphocytidyl-2-C-methyl-D-erythritol kinase